MGIAEDVRFIINQPAYSYYQLFDYFAQTSDKEGISIALLEAMSFGLTCVVTTKEEKHAVIESGSNGLVVEAGNIQKLVQAFERLIENSPQHRSLGEKAIKTVERSFNRQHMLVGYTKIFEELV